MLFDYLDMAGNHEERKVANTVIGKTIIDTCRVTDSPHPFETGIEDTDYCDGWIIVETYDTKEQAQKGHSKWVIAFSGTKPAQLKDVNTCNIAKFINALGGDVNKTYKKAKK